MRSVVLLPADAAEHPTPRARRTSPALTRRKDWFVIYCLIPFTLAAGSHAPDSLERFRPFVPLTRSLPRQYRTADDVSCIRAERHRRPTVANLHRGHPGSYPNYPVWEP